jgi:hypothetical protein
MVSCAERAYFAFVPRSFLLNRPVAMGMFHQLGTLSAGLLGKLTSRLALIEKDFDLGRHFAGLAVQLVRFETPLSNSTDGGVGN